MTKFKWFKMSFKKDFSFVAEKFSENKFSEDSEDGFIISKIQSGLIAGKYVKKTTFVKDIINPFGGLEEINAIDYFIISFEIDFYPKPTLRITNPKRTIKPLLTKLNSILGFNFSISDIMLNPLHILNDIEDIFGEIKVDKIELNDINIDNKALATLILKSEQDVRYLIKNDITNNRNYKIKNIKGSFLSPNFMGGKIEISDNLSLSISNVPEAIFLDNFSLIISNLKP